VSTYAIVFRCWRVWDVVEANQFFRLPS
jgi:hypothetical protein